MEQIQIQFQFQNNNNTEQLNQPTVLEPKESLSWKEEIFKSHLFFPQFQFNTRDS